jgi:hypothetical protein
MSLPMFPELTERQCETVATAVKGLAADPLKAAV